MRKVRHVLWGSLALPVICRLSRRGDKRRFVRRTVFISIGAPALLALLALGRCGGAASPAGDPLPTPAIQPTPGAAAQPTARAVALQVAAVLVPYRDPLGTYELRRPQTWVALDRRSNPRFAGALGDDVRFFEPIVASDPDAGASGKLWIDVLPARPGTTPLRVLLQPFVDADYPPSLLRRMTLAPTRLGGLPGYRLVTLAGRTQATLLLVRDGPRYYRVTVFGASVPPEVAPALRTWRFLPLPRR